MDIVWSYRRYMAGDEDQLFVLFRVVWGWKLGIPEKNQWIKGWQWMFINNPAGTSIMWLAEHNDKLIGEYPLVMVDMKVGNKLAKAGQIADTMTHPQYRRLGIAFALGNESLSEMKEQNALLAFGFPTAEAYPLHRKSGWVDVCDIKTMIKPLNLKNMLEGYLTHNKLLISIFSKLGELPLKITFKARKSPSIDGLTITEVFRFDDRFDGFWEQISKDYNIIVARTKKYLNWRYIDVPNANYTIYMAEKNKKIYGYMVLDYKYHNGLAFGRILDIIAPVNQQIIIYYLISKAVEHFEQKRMDAIYSSIICNRYLNVFLKCGFIPYPKSKNRFIAYKASSDISDVYITNPKNWFIQLGDLPMIF